MLLDMKMIIPSVIVLVLNSVWARAVETELCNQGFVSVKELELVSLFILLSRNSAQLSPHAYQRCVDSGWGRVRAAH